MKSTSFFFGALCAILLSSTCLKAQVTITYVVDMTLYLDSGNALDTTGMRIGGKFSSMGISNIPDWTPSASPCAMTNLGFNRWGISIQYPDSAIGKFQDFKFVNGNWGPGKDERSTDLAGCGYISGGIVNRRIQIPGNDSTFRYCWNRCTPCPVQFSVQTGQATFVTSSSATISAYVTGSGIIQQGIVFGPNSNPQLQNSSSIDAGSGDGSFSVALSNLNPGTQYYFRTFARRNNGTTYGSVASFSTLAAGQLTYVTYQVNISNYLAEGNVTGSDGIRIAGNFMRRGARRGGLTMPDWIPSDSTCAMENLGNNIWSITLGYPDSSLGKIQEFRFYNSSQNNAEATDSLISGGCAITEAGLTRRVHSISFTTDTAAYCWGRCVFECGPAPAAPVLTNAQTGQISFHSALITASAAGNNISLRGICFSTSPSPDTSDAYVTAAAGSGNFSVLLEDLSPGTNYYARAFALNNIGISYGTELVFSTAQAFTVTYKVDISSYLSAGNTVGANGIRIGGNFTDRGCTLPNWTPSDTACAMTEGPDNIWSITVLYPDSAAGKTQRYKFVNNDWGTNEGSPSLVSGGCGIQDGGDVNRILVLPAAGGTVSFCWDECNQACQLSAGDPLEEKEFSIFPVPFENEIQVHSVKTGFVRLMNLQGKIIFSARLHPGNQIIRLPELSSGLYLFQHSEGKTEKIFKK